MDLNLVQLRQLVTFADEGTITKASEVMLISQPALTRSLQKLEYSLGIKLFDRQKNKTTLTETGSFVVEEAKLLLESADNFMVKIQHQNLKNTTLFIGVNAPGAVFEIEDRIREKNDERNFEFTKETHEKLMEKLNLGELDLIVTNRKVEEYGLLCRILFKEQLFLVVPEDHKLANKQEVTTDDLKGLTMLLYDHLGIWEDFVAPLKDTTFIRQKDRNTFTALLSASQLPYFNTNITQSYFGMDEKRVHIPISNPEAIKTFYAVTQQQNHNFFDIL